MQPTPISEIKPDRRNANKGSKRGKEAIKESIARFGFIDAGILDKNGRLIGGNKRTEAAQEAGYEQVNIVKGDPNVPTYVQYDHLDLEDPDDTTARELAYVLNRTQQLSLTWDPEILRTDAQSIDLTKLFTAEELAAICGKPTANPRPAAPPSPDRGAELQAKWNVRSGDIWQVGPHLIACGDCTDSTLWQKLDTTVQGIFTSPPYAEQRKDQYESIPTSEYVSWFGGLVQPNLSQSLSDDGSFFLNIKPHVEDGQRALYVYDLVGFMVREYGWKLIDEFCWQRIGNPGSWPNRFKNGFEPVYHFAQSTKIKFNPQAVSANRSGEFTKTQAGTNTGNYYHRHGFEWETALPSNSLDLKDVSEALGHPAAFPVALPDFFIRAYSNEGDAWLDPFLGSGSTIVAAHQNNRKGVGIEISPAYVAITLERLAELTKETPERGSLR